MNKFIKLLFLFILIGSVGFFLTEQANMFNWSLKERETKELVVNEVKTKPLEDNQKDGAVNKALAPEEQSKKIGGLLQKNESHEQVRSCKS